MESDLGRLLAYLALRDDLTNLEQLAISGLPHQNRTFKRNAKIVADHARPIASCVIIKGFAARTVFVEDGSRQITAVHVPGDFVDLHALLLKVMDHSVVALSDCEVAFVAHEHLVAITERHAHLGRLLWLSTVIDAAIHRAWLACIGRRSPSQHIAHLLCEVYVRLHSIGLAQDYQFEFPITQADLADMLGLSVVHVNKTLADLRKMQMFTWRGTSIEINSFVNLAQHAGFDPIYLSLVKIPR